LNYFHILPICIWDHGTLSAQAYESYGPSWAHRGQALPWLLLFAWSESGTLKNPRRHATSFPTGLLFCLHPHILCVLCWSPKKFCALLLCCPALFWFAMHYIYIYIYAVYIYIYSPPPGMYVQKEIGRESE